MIASTVWNITGWFYVTLHQITFIWTFWHNTCIVVENIASKATIPITITLTMMITVPATARTMWRMLCSKPTLLATMPSPGSVRLLMESCSFFLRFLLKFCWDDKTWKYIDLEISFFANCLGFDRFMMEKCSYVIYCYCSKKYLYIYHYWVLAILYHYTDNWENISLSPIDYIIKKMKGKVGKEKNQDE